MSDEPQSAPRPRRKLPCGAISCGGCVKECGIVVYRYIANLEEAEERGDRFLDRQSRISNGVNDSHGKLDESARQTKSIDIAERTVVPKH